MEDTTPPLVLSKIVEDVLALVKYWVEEDGRFLKIPVDKLPLPPVLKSRSSSTHQPM